TDPDASQPKPDGPTEACLSPSRAKSVQDAVEAATAGARADSRFVGLAVGVIDGDNAASFYYGKANIGKQTPRSAQSIMRIGSNTKPFTATMLANLARLGIVKVGVRQGDPPET